MREKLVADDVIECVLGLGPNLFYNSPMEACVVICRTQKPIARQGKVLFIDAVHEVAREGSQSFLRHDNQERIVKAYQNFADESDFAAVVSSAEILGKDGNLSIPRYVRRTSDSRDGTGPGDLRSAWSEFDASGREFWLQLDALVEMLEGTLADGEPHA